jgi:NAD(P)-dependent dehydrogenase (short-subunit alcohol dehydrogenase family)
VTRTRPVAIVTGGTRGIGLGIAQALARDGWNLALCGTRSADAVSDAIASLGRDGAEVTYTRMDVARVDEHEGFVSAARKRWGRINGLVNNAGRAPRVRADLLQATVESFDEVLATNLRGAYALTQRVAQVLVSQRANDAVSPAAIVFVTSVSATLASINRGEYCVSKAGLAMAAQLFALRLAEHEVGVYDVRPGIIETDMTAANKAVYDKRIADEGLVPERRWGTPEDVGRVVASLMRGDLPYATGSVITVDGGLSIPRL